MVYEKYVGNEAHVSIENISEETPYTEIGEKAFLSCKEIKTLTLPKGIEKIGNWGFAHMKRLEELTIPANDITLGREVFLDCPKLQEIHLYPDASNNPGLPFLLASVINVLGDFSLFKPKQAAGMEEASFNSHVGWMQAYDGALLQFLYAADDAGFVPVLIGWFDDEGEDTQRSRYVEERRKQKASLCFLRLTYDMHLSPDNRELIYAYMRQHVPGDEMTSSNNRLEESSDQKQVGNSHIAVWELLGTDIGKDVRNIQIVETAGILTGNRCLLLMEYLRKKEPDPEVMAYLLMVQKKLSGQQNPWDALNL